MNDKTVDLLLKEAGLITSCIEQGLTSLRKASFQNKASYYQAFFLLTIGIERLLKIIIITKYRIDGDELPSNKDLKDYGHNIGKLFQKVVNEQRPNDNFLDSDEIYKQILNCLSRYALVSRYYNLDTITNAKRSEDPVHEWKKIQNIIEKRHGKPRDLTYLSRETQNILNNKLFISMTNEQDENIDTATNYLLEFTNLDKVQGYSVLYLYQIICYLVDILNELSYKKHMLPYFTEFFTLFNTPMKTKDVVKRKNWNYMLTSK